MIELPGGYEEQIKFAHSLCENERFDDAKRLLLELLSENPNDHQALFLLAYTYGTGFGESETAYHLYRRVLDYNPDRWEVYINIGQCLHPLWRHEEALKWAQTAAEMRPDRACVWVDQALCYLWLAKPYESMECALKALELEPGNMPALDNLSLAQLMIRDWANGWDNYEISLGLKFRKEYIYGNEERWDGSEGSNLIVYGEQGLGDELLFASCLPETIERCNKVILDVNPKLKGLFQRSFPETKVYGTRWDETVVFEEDHEIDARASFGSLPRFFRRQDEDFPGTPYLTPCPVRVKQWQTALDELGPGMKVGIAWTGGMRRTGRDDRCIRLKEWADLLEMDAHFIDLEYEDPEQEIVDQPCKVHHFPWGTMTQDYDDTAALVQALDLVISVPTSVVHLAGALGKECWCLVNSQPNWRFGLEMPEEEGDEVLIWSRSVKLLRGDNLIQQVARRLHACISGYRQQTPDSRDGADVIHHETPIQTDSPNPAFDGTLPNQKNGVNDVHVPEVSGSGLHEISRHSTVHGQ